MTARDSVDIDARYFFRNVRGDNDDDGGTFTVL
jgi:hypothetical protein